MAPRKNPKPEPVIVSQVCSECGMDWEGHGEDPTAFDCIRLLREALDRPRPCQLQHWPYTWNQGYNGQGYNGLWENQLGGTAAPLPTLPTIISNMATAEIVGDVA